MKMETRRFLFLTGALCFWILLLQNADLATGKDPDYPVKPITYYISFGPGGTADLANRAFIEGAAKHLGKPFIPINRAGAGGSLAATAVLNAKPDGYTLGGTPAGIAFTLPFTEPAPYKELSGFTFIVNFGKLVYPLMVRADAPWETWSELMEWAKKNPKGVKVGITGAREVTVQGYTLLKIEKLENVKFTYMPLKSSAETLSATLGGHITLYGSTVDASTMPYLKERKVRILAFMGLKDEKIPGYENIPSTEELYGVSIPKALGVMGPKGLPENILNRLDDAFAKTIKDPDFNKVMDRMCIPVVYMNRAKMNKHMDELYRQGAEFIKMLKAEEAKEKN